MRDRTAALLNVTVFAPLAFYAWRGQKAPELLVLVAAVVGIGTFLRDLRTVVTPEPPSEAVRSAGPAPAGELAGPRSPGRLLNPRVNGDERPRRRRRPRLELVR